MPVAHQHEWATPTLQEDIARCVHCGFCLQACPTYLDLGMETDSPRGRISLIDAMAAGRATPTPSLLGHLDLCLQCRACETACPSGVPFGRIMETARAEVLESPGRPLAWWMRKMALRQTLPHQPRLRQLFRVLRAYERSPLSRLVRRANLPAPLRSAESSVPRVPSSGFVEPSQPPQVTRTVAMLTGCVMPHTYPRTHDATVRVLNHLGYRVAFAPQQTCCGALSLHAGDREFARSLARRNIDAFGDDVEAIVVNSAGCGSTMKEYHELLAADPVYAGRARRCVDLTRDLLEFIAGHDLGALGPLPIRVTYQDSCHLVHAQKITAAPRSLLRAIPALELREMAAPDRCCGSAGLYSVVQGEMSGRLRERKIDDIATTGATVVATANPGCMMQIESGLRSRAIEGRVVHVVELLDASMRAAETLRLRPRLRAS